MNNHEINYWAFRIANSSELYTELKEGRLRQGWGSEPGQDLRKIINGDDDAINDGARRNLPMFYKVKKGDIILTPVPNSVEWGKIAILNATGDWDAEYKFEICEGVNDFGHIFPIKFLTTFARHNELVEGELRRTFRCRRRFWSIYKCKNNIDTLINLSGSEELSEVKEKPAKLTSVIKTSFAQIFIEERRNALIDNIKLAYKAAEWEDVIQIGLEKISSDNQLRVETSTNKEEAEHGADIIIRFSNPIDDSLEYAIAVQIKDHEGNISKGVIDQICKADKYWDDNETESKLIEKMVIVTNAESGKNKEITEYAKSKDVRILYKKEFDQLLLKIANSFIDISNLD